MSFLGKKRYGKTHKKLQPPLNNTHPFWAKAPLKIKIFLIPFDDFEKIPRSPPPSKEGQGRGKNYDHVLFP